MAKLARRLVKTRLWPIFRSGLGLRPAGPGPALPLITWAFVRSQIKGERHLASEIAIFLIGIPPLTPLDPDGFPGRVGAVLQGIPEGGLAVGQELGLSIRRIGLADIVDIIGGRKAVKQLETNAHLPVEAVFDPGAQGEADSHASIGFSVGVCRRPLPFRSQAAQKDLLSLVVCIGIVVEDADA